MPDSILKDESTAALREVQILLETPGGDPATGITELTATIKISKPGANFVASTATLTEVTGGSVQGQYRLRFPAGEIDTVGDLQFEIAQTGDIKPVSGYVTVLPLSMVNAFEQVAEGSYTYGDLQRLSARSLAAPFTKTGSDYVIRDLDDSKDSHESTVTPSGKTGVNIIDPT